MPWDRYGAKAHTKSADTPKKQQRWAEVANSVLKKTGDDAKAIRIANAQVKK